MDSENLLKTPKEFWDKFEPKWDELRAIMNKFPNTFRLYYSEAHGYFLETHLTSLEEHLPVTIGDCYRKMKNESGLQFKEIKSEKYRTYEWADGFKLTIVQPIYLNVSGSGGHRLFDASGKSHYIPSGWVHLYWEVFDGQPNFVK